MADSLAQTVTLYALVLAGWATAGVVTGRRSGAFAVAAVVLEAGLALQAVLDLVSPSASDERATHLGYLAVSVLVLPAAYGWAGRDRTRWGSATMSLACICLAVVVVRLRQTVS